MFNANISAHHSEVSVLGEVHFLIPLTAKQLSQPDVLMTVLSHLLHLSSCVSISVGQDKA